MATPVTVVDANGAPVTIVTVNGQPVDLTGGNRVLASSAVAVSHTGNLVETVLATVAIPAGEMGLNGILQVTSFWTVTASVNAKTLRHRLGGLAGTVFGTVGPTSSGTVTNPFMVTTVMNRNSASSQVAQSMRNRTVDLLDQGEQATGAVNTALAQDLVFTGHLALLTETITLESYIVERIAP